MSTSQKPNIDKHERRQCVIIAVTAVVPQNKTRQQSRRIILFRSPGVHEQAVRARRSGTPLVLAGPRAPLALGLGAAALQLRMSAALQLRMLHFFKRRLTFFELEPACPFLMFFQTHANSKNTLMLYELTLFLLWKR